MIVSLLLSKSGVGVSAISIRKDPLIEHVAQFPALIAPCALIMGAPEYVYVNVSARAVNTPKTTDARTNITNLSFMVGNPV